MSSPSIIGAQISNASATYYVDNATNVVQATIEWTSLAGAQAYFLDQYVRIGGTYTDINIASVSAYNSPSGNLDIDNVTPYSYTTTNGIATSDNKTIFTFVIYAVDPSGNKSNPRFITNTVTINN